MHQEELSAAILALPRVEMSENFGYAFYFVGADHRLPFATIAARDQEFDKFSHLDREGVYRLNVGVSKATFDAVVAELGEGEPDYTACNVFLPHPEYAKQHFLCILSPTGAQAERTRAFLNEAHALAAARLERQSSTEVD